MPTPMTSRHVAQQFGPAQWVVTKISRDVLLDDTKGPLQLPSPILTYPDCSMHFARMSLAPSNSGSQNFG